MRTGIQILAVALLFASSNAEAGIQASLSADTTVVGTRITLGDIATLDGGDKLTRQALSAIDLGSAPLSGYSARFTRNEIERLVRSQTADRSITWRGADTIRVERVSSVLDPAQVSEIAADYLRQVLRGEAERVELQLSGPLPDLLLPTGRLEFRPRPMTPAQAMHRRVTVWVDILINGAFVRSLTVPFEVRAYRPVLVARHDLPRGAIPDCSILRLHETDITSLDMPPVAADCHAIEGHLKRALPQGDPLLKSNLQAPIPVATGDSVNLQMTDGAVTLESRAIALADGEVGQRINVRPSGGTGTIMAEVVGPATVKVTGR